MITVLPSTTLTARPHHRHDGGAWWCAWEPSRRVNRRSADSGKRARALQYAEVSSSLSSGPRRLIQAASRLRAHRQERSGLSICQKKVQKVTQGV